MADLTQLHGFRDSVRWSLGPQGVDVEGSGVERTPGAPTTVTRVWEGYSNAINQVAQEYDVPCVLIVATICTESAGKADAIRLEPGYKSDEETPNKVSPGLMQTLISTARDALQATVDRQWLLEPANSIKAGTAFIAKQRALTNLDPPLVAAAYNAGGLRYDSSAANRWKLVQYPVGTSEHCDRFVKWFNDAVAALSTHATKAAVPYGRLLDTAAAAQSFADARLGAQSPPAGKITTFPPEPFERMETAQPVAAVATALVGNGGGAPTGKVTTFPPEPFERMETAEVIPATATGLAAADDLRTPPTGSITTFPPEPFERMETAERLTTTAAALGDGIADVLGSARKILGAVVGGAEVAAAVAAGDRNEDHLTDIVFYARHPDRRGRPIGRGDTQLAREWTAIRDSTVRPVLLILQTSSAPAPSPAPSPGAPSEAPGPQVPFDEIARRLLAAAAKHQELGVDLPGDQARRIPCVLTKLLDPVMDDRAILMNVWSDMWRGPNPLDKQQWDFLLSHLRTEMTDLFNQSLHLGSSDAEMLAFYRDFYDAQIFRNNHWLLQQEFPLGGGSSVPASTREIHDWVASQQNSQQSIYSCFI